MIGIIPNDFFGLCCGDERSRSRKNVGEGGDDLDSEKKRAPNADGTSRKNATDATNVSGDWGRSGF